MKVVSNLGLLFSTIRLFHSQPLQQQQQHQKHEQQTNDEHRYQTEVVQWPCEPIICACDMELQAQKEREGS